MSNQMTWKPLGNYSKEARVSIAVAAIAVIFCSRDLFEPCRKLRAIHVGFGLRGCSGCWLQGL
jgi:hypothetical protein